MLIPNPRTLLCAACAAVFALATPAMAQPGQKAAAAQQATQAKVQQIQTEMQKLGMQLAAIERKAIATDTHLQAKRDHFSAHMVKVMKTLGYDPEGDSKQLAEIKHKVLGGKLKQDERVAQIKKFRSIRAHLMQGQMAAMQDKSLLKESQQLNEATMVAMKKQDPQAEAMMKRFDALGTKLRSLLRSSRAQKH